MSSYNNFQSNNAKYSNLDNRTTTSADLTSHVDVSGVEKQSAFEKNLNKYIEFASWMNWLPDLFLDLITPQEGGIRLHADQRIYLRCILRFFSVYGVFPRGWSKCVTGDTILYTDEGLKEIGEYFNHMQTGIEFYISNSINLINKNGVLVNSNKGVYSGYKDTKKIITEEGYELEGTYNHPILIIDKNGDIEFRELKDLSIGDYVVINRKNNVWGNNTYLNLSELDDWFNLCSSQQRSHLKKRKLPNILDEEMALLIGYLLGDGCMTLSNNILFSNKDQDILSHINSIFKNKYNVELVRLDENKCDYIIRDKYLRKYFEVIGLKQVNAFKKEIPQCVLSAPSNIVAKVLQGLFDTDGTVDSKSISLCSVSNKLIKQVQLLLLNFGIITRVSKRSQGRFSHNILFIYGENIDKFNEVIGFSCGYKQIELNNIINKSRNTNKDIIPYQNKYILDFYEDAKKNNKYLYDKIYHIIKGNSQLSYSKLKMLLNLNDAESCANYNHLKRIQDLGYFYSKVANISDGKNHVYDLQVPDTNSFVSNGFVSHNTYLEVLAMFIVAIRYPGIELALTAQTKDNAAEILKDKTMEILKHYPLLNNEIYDKKFSKGDANISFSNGSRIDILANSQSSKGQRRKRINIEESALLDNVTFQDALKPIVEVPRYTVGKLGITNPEELNQQINFFTTSGFRGSDEFVRSLDMLDNMSNLLGEIILGSDWHLGCWYGRGSTKSQIKNKKKTMSPIAFAQNYESKWVGSTDGALVNINKVMKLRTLNTPLLRNDKNYEIILSVDVARSEASSNNRSSMSILQIHRTSSGNISLVSQVNLFTISNDLPFESQAIEVKRTKKLFKAKVVVVDSNGLGKGLLDCLLKEQIDPITKEILPAYATINTDLQPETKHFDRCVYDLKPQSAQSEIIVSFIDFVESARLELLEKKALTDYDISDKEHYITNILPFLNTDLLIEEIANLQLIENKNKKFSIAKVVNKIDKDRFSSLAYGLWYINSFEKVFEKDEVDYSKLVISSNARHSGGKLFGSSFKGFSGTKTSNPFRR